MTRYYVLDSSAIVCFLRGEHGADVLKPLLKDQNNQHVLHAVNWVEVRYLEQRGQFSGDGLFRRLIETVGVEISADLGPSLLEKAARLKADYSPIALGDCFAVALAQTLATTLITTDRGELQKVAEANTCDILFLR